MTAVIKRGTARRLGLNRPPVVYRVEPSMENLIAGITELQRRVKLAAVLGLPGFVPYRPAKEVD